MVTPAGTKWNVTRGAAATVLALAFGVAVSAWWLPDPRSSGGHVPLGVDVVMIAAPDLRLDAAAQSRADLRLLPPWSSADGIGAGIRVMLSRVWQPALAPPGWVWMEQRSSDGLVLGSWIVEGNSATGEPAPAPGEFDALQRLTEVRIMRDQQIVRECVRAFGRHRCGPDPWNWVGPTSQTVEGRAEDCTWLHPHSDGSVVLRFDVPVGYSGLELEFALSDHAAESRAAPVEVALNLDGLNVRSTRSSLSVEPRQGWQRLEVALPDGHTGMSANLSVATTETGLGHLCGRVLVSAADEQVRSRSVARPRVSTARLEAQLRLRLRWLELSTPRWMRSVRTVFRAEAARVQQSEVEP